MRTPGRLLLTVLLSRGTAVDAVRSPAALRRAALRPLPPGACATEDDALMLRRAGLRTPPPRACATEGECSLDRRCIYFVTGNAMKEREVNAIIAVHALPFRVEHVDLDLEELQGDPEAICRAKVARAAEHVGGSVLVEDTSLCFNALNGLPGPYIKWFFNALGNAGLHRLLDGHADKTAYARCILGFMPAPGATPILFTGLASGVIVEPSGEGGFGWDACFVPDGHTVPFGAMHIDQKNRISHRAQVRALRRASGLGAP